MEATMTVKTRFGAAVLLPSLLLAACEHTPTAPTQVSSSVATNRAHLEVTSLDVTGEARTTGNAYRVVAHLRETAGTAAAIASIELKFSINGTTVASSRSEHPISDASNVCPANGTVATMELLTVDTDAAHPYATSVQVVVTYAATPSVTATADATAQVPAAATAPPLTYTLRGLIQDESTRAGIASARIDIVSGSNAGRTTLTDQSGSYVLNDLTGGSFRLRASANGFDSGEQGVTVPTNPQADFLLRKSVGCFYTLSASYQVVLTSGLASTLTLTPSVGSGCAWSAVSSVPWIALAGATTGTGAGTVSYRIDQNSSSSYRTGAITITWSGGSATFSVNQLPSRTSCAPQINLQLPPNQWEGYINVGTGCYFAEKTTIDVPWIEIRSTHGGGLFVDVAVQANTGAARTGHITFADGGVAYMQITISQDTGGNCVTAVSPASVAFDENGGPGQLTVTGTAGCSWTARPENIALTIGAGSTGTGSGTVSFTVPPNPAVYSRNGNINVGGIRSAIVQRACPTNASPSELNVPAAGGTFTITVGSSAMCTWTATTASSFITIVRADEVRTGPGSVTVTIAPNTTGQARTGFLGAASQTIQVMQSAS
jgi:hypothetical protein